MKKLVILVSFIFIFTLLLTGCANSNNQNPIAIRTAMLTDSDNGKSISLKSYENLEVTLKDYGDGGYQFAEPQYDKKILQLQSTKNIPATSGAAGDFGKDQWLFKATNKGETTLKMEIYRPWETDQKTTVFQIKVAVD